MIIAKEELKKKFMERIGDDTSDEALSLIEDFTDTIEDYEERTKETTDWKTKYEEAMAAKDELDASWRKRYKDRFMDIPADSGVDFVEQAIAETEEEPDIVTPTTYEELFTVEE